MLVLQIPVESGVQIGAAHVRVLDTRAGGAKLGITAPPEIAICRDNARDYSGPLPHDRAAALLVACQMTLGYLREYEDAATVSPQNRPDWLWLAKDRLCKAIEEEGTR